MPPNHTHTIVHSSAMYSKISMSSVNLLKMLLMIKNEEKKVLVLSEY